MNGVLVVPLNPKRLNVISTDTLFVGALRSVLCVILRMQQIVLIYLRDRILIYVLGISLLYIKDK